MIVEIPNTAISNRCVAAQAVCLRLLMFRIATGHYSKRMDTATPPDQSILTLLEPPSIPLVRKMAKYYCKSWVSERRRSSSSSSPVSPSCGETMPSGSSPAHRFHKERRGPERHRHGARTVETQPNKARLSLDAVDLDLVAFPLLLQGLCQHELPHPIDPLILVLNGEVVDLATR